MQGEPKNANLWENSDNSSFEKEALKNEHCKASSW